MVSLSGLGVGACYGPRPWVPFLPLLAIAAVALARRTGRPARAALAVLATISVCTGIWGALHYEDLFSH